MIDGETVRGLLEPGHCLVSVYMPVEPEERDLRAHVARLRRLLDTATALLERRGTDSPARDALLDPLREYNEGTAFAEHRDPGLAIFARAGAAPHITPLPISPGEGVFVGPDFHIKPLLPLLAANRRFYILALSRGNVRLLSATPFGWTEVPLDALPAEVQAELDSRPAADGPDTLEEVRTALMVAEPRRVGAAVKAALGEDEAPLILAADPSVAGHFTQQVELRQMMAKQLHLNPFGISEAELHAKAVECVRPELDAELQAVLDQVNARLGTAEKTVAIRLEEILGAASEGRVDAVVVAADELVWGRFDAGHVHAHGTPGVGDEDLLNQAAVMAMRTGGRAFAIPRERLPRQVPAAATLRY